MRGPVVPSWRVDFGMASTVAPVTAASEAAAAAVDFASPVVGNEARTAVNVEAPNSDPGSARGVDPLVLVWVAGLTVGLGLLIVRRIVRAHGGEVIIESERNRGLTLTIRLPRADRRVRFLEQGSATDGRNPS